MPKASDHTDIVVGARVRLRRKEMGLSQAVLGERVGITFQQIQKYEKGANRIGAGRLQLIARALDVPVSYFFPQEDATVSVEVSSLLDRPGAIALLKDFVSIEQRSCRRALCTIARALARDHVSD